MNFPDPYKIVFAGLGLFLLLVPNTLQARSLQKAHDLYFNGHPKDALTLYKKNFSVTGSTLAILNAAVLSQEMGKHRQLMSPLKR